MRILGISGSPRGRVSGTRRLVKQVLAGAQAAGAQTELVDIGDMHIAFCEACDVCHASGECTRVDEFPQISERLLAADGLVFGSPLYFNSVTAQLKTLIDRCGEIIHCQRFLGKYAGSVCVSGGPEHDLGVAYMNDVLLRLGCAIVGGVGVCSSVPGSLAASEASAAELGRDLAQAIAEQRTYPDQEAVHAEMHARFKRLVSWNKDHWPHEYAYWRERGWLD